MSTDAQSAGVPTGEKPARRHRGVETRAYFRCDRLAATLSVEQCRANRGRMTPQEMMALAHEVPTWWVQPLPCWSCALAAVVESGGVPFFSAEQVLAGQVPGSPEPRWEHAPPRHRASPPPVPSAAWCGSGGVGLN